MMVKNFGLFTASSDPLIQIKLLQFRVDCCVCGVVAEARGGEEGSTQARWLEARHRVVVDPLVVEIWNVLKNWRSVGEVLEGLWEIIRTLRNQSRVLGLAAFRLGTKGNRTDWVVWFGDGDERNSMWGGSRMYPTVGCDQGEGRVQSIRGVESRIPCRSGLDEWRMSGGSPGSSMGGW